MIHDCLKNEQREAILNVLEGNLVPFFCQPDMGKSLIFQALQFAIEFFMHIELIVWHFSFQFGRTTNTEIRTCGQCGNCLLSFKVAGLSIRQVTSQLIQIELQAHSIEVATVITTYVNISVRL